MAENSGSSTRVTRSLSREIEKESITAMREEMQTLFKFDELKNIIRSAVSEAIKEDSSGLKEVIDEAIGTATKALETTVQDLESKLEEYRALINDNEQYSRKYNLRISGIKESPGESCVDKVMDLCQTKLNIIVEKDSIDRAHCLGPKKDGKDRQIIVKFTKFPVKNTIYRSKRLLKGT